MAIFANIYAEIVTHSKAYLKNIHILNARNAKAHYYVLLLCSLMRNMIAHLIHQI
jgi:hypothetical protein